MKVNRIQEYDVVTLRALLERHHKSAWGWALHCCASQPQSAEDVLQETYIRVLEGRACFKGQSGFRTWLFGVVRFVALEHGMRETRIENRIVALSDDAIGESRVAQTETATYSTTVSDTSSMLSVALAELPERQREVLHLMFYQEMSIAEAAVAMGVELGTARTHYKRGEKTMKEKLEQKIER